MSYVFILFFFLLLQLSLYANTYTIQELKEPALFKNEICSYNGEPHEYQDANQKTRIYCICKKEYANITNLNRQINGVNIQCSYERKRRLFILFFCLIFPLGLEYIYLEKYIWFIVFFVIEITMIAGNCIIFAKNEIAKNKEQDEQYKKKRKILSLCFNILTVFCILMYLINVILLCSGVIKDNNEVETINDISEVFGYLFNI